MPTLADDLISGRPLGSDASSLALAARAFSSTSPATGQIPSLATGGLIPCNLSTAYFFTTAGAVTGVLMQKGVTPGQLAVLANTSANNATFASSTTSFVADGANVSVLANRAIILIWDAVNQLWVAFESAS